MEFDFIRKLANNITNADSQKIYQILTDKGIEVFVKKENGFSNMTLNDSFEKNDLYVSAADLDFAITLVEGLGLGQYLCSEAEANVHVEKSEVEKAEEEFYRKHRQNQIFAWVIIAGVAVFMIFQLIK